MKKLYTFDIPYSGIMSVWTEAESEEEARQAILRGEWRDSNEEDYTAYPEKSMELIRVYDPDEEIE